MLPNNKLELVMYQSAKGQRPFELWLHELDVLAASKVSSALERMAEGNLCDVRSVGAGVLERRIHWGPGYRVYFGRDGNYLVVLLAGGTKQRQHSDIERAQRRWADYKQRKLREEES